MRTRTWGLRLRLRRELGLGLGLGLGLELGLSLRSTSSLKPKASNSRLRSAGNRKVQASIPRRQNSPGTIHFPGRREKSPTLHHSVYERHFEEEQGSEWKGGTLQEIQSLSLERVVRRNEG